MRALLGAAALAPLRAFAAPKSRPVIWLLGLTGCGKTFLASLLMNLFGDYPLDACGRIATWGSTDNSCRCSATTTRTAWSSSTTSSRR